MAEGDATNFLKKKVGGLPVGVWLLIIVAGVGVGLYIRNKAVDTVADDVEDLEGDDGSADIVPIDSLPAEDPGYFPAAGPPNVFGGGAIRLTPDTLRIRVVYPRRKRKNKGGGKGGKKHHPNMDGGPNRRRDRSPNAHNAG